MKGGGTLTISTRLMEPGNKVEIRFKDTGRGIKKEFRDKVFNYFFTTKPVGEGTGLGLPVCLQIMNRYGGDITFETVSEEEDMARKGTTFIITLPVAPPEIKQNPDQK